MLKRTFIPRELSFSHKDTIVIAAAAAKSLQSCPTLCDPIDGSLPGSAVPGILQARTLEWVLASAIWQEKEMYPSWKRKSKIVLFANAYICKMLHSVIY